ncbi:uncharacterized protein JN550_006280 [Neoarthrinium moseri]|uniref:uncharacterized protein n=1 Tax=Neoarthrinium moseri TaxID=1658444 RepID=UPI001FDE6CE4|nr:uncharacterized protein JN550_006280 [Neoarthrinium moseri]KAI1868705.1 hypothetical protein JN550_006280 [Neoarthrinium moseri]
MPTTLSTTEPSVSASEVDTPASDASPAPEKQPPARSSVKSETDEHYTPVVSDIAPHTLKAYPLDRMPSTEQASATARTRDALPAPPVAVSPRCELCRKQRQKCNFTSTSGKCDRCSKGGHECRLVDFVQRRPYVSRLTRGSRLKESGQRQCAAPSVQPQRTMARRKVTASKPTAQAPVEPESDNSDSNASIPPTLPTARKRKRKNASTSEQVQGEVVGQLRGTIVKMDEEFKEILKDVQEKHAQELAALRAKYERAMDDLVHMTRSHERRVDDLIQIIKSNERRVDDLLDTMKARTRT